MSAEEFPEKITYEWLVEYNACPAEIDRFVATWPRGVTVTVRNILRADRLGFDVWDWFVCQLPLVDARAYYRAVQRAVHDPRTEWPGTPESEDRQHKRICAIALAAVWRSRSRCTRRDRRNG